MEFTTLDHYSIHRLQRYCKEFSVAKQGIAFVPLLERSPGRVHFSEGALQHVIDAFIGLFVVWSIHSLFRICTF